MRLRALVMAALVMATPLSTALADSPEWRACIASSERTHNTYLTDPFLTTAGMKALESGFEEALTADGAAVDNIQCPRSSSDAGLRSVLKHAQEYNLDLGYRLHWTGWSPQRPTAMIR